MQNFNGALLRHIFARLLAITLACSALVLLSGCATHYLDAGTKGVESSEYRRPAQPAPVQLLFDFETKGVQNARATELLKETIKEQVQSSGLFATVDDKSVTGGALLEVKVNNVPVNDDAFSKGFVTGLTFGLAGSQVSDGYVCTVRYVKGDGTITKTARHAIHTTIGNAAVPVNAVKVKDLTEAVKTMIRQVLSTALNDLSNDASFR